MKYCASGDMTPWVAPTNYSEDALNLAISAASDYIDQITGDSFERIDGIKTFSGRGKGLLLVNPSLHGVTSVTVYNADGSVDGVLESDTYTFEESFVKLTSNYMTRHKFPVGQGNLKIDGLWGQAAVPALIRLACAKLAATILTGESPDHVLREKVGHYEIEYQNLGRQEAFTIWDILERYKLRAIEGGILKGRSVDDSDVSPRSWRFIGD